MATATGKQGAKSLTSSIYIMMHASMYNGVSLHLPCTFFL